MSDIRKNENPKVATIASNVMDYMAAIKRETRRKLKNQFDVARALHASRGADAELKFYDTAADLIAIAIIDGKNVCQMEVFDRSYITGDRELAISLAKKAAALLVTDGFAAEVRQKDGFPSKLGLGPHEMIIHLRTRE